MSKGHDFEEIYLPDDLRALDEELSSIRYEERPSFGPELRAELAKEWAARPGLRTATLRHLIAAAAAGLLIGGVAVPSARASLVRMFEGLTAGRAIPEEPALLDMPPPPLPTIGEPLDLEESMVPLPVTPPAVVLEEDLVTPARATLPEMLDRARAEVLFQQAYPRHLQQRGIGGEVWLKVWVDIYGMTSLARVARSSGESDLDQAATGVAPLLRFQPAMQGGAPVATWAEFPVNFRPGAGRLGVAAESREDPMTLPDVDEDDRWQYEAPLDVTALPQWSTAEGAELTEIEAALTAAIGDLAFGRDLGPIGAIVSGIAPQGEAPVEWRSAVGSVLEAAIVRGPDNPAPLLALGRIRVRQGLRIDARMHFEQGLQIAMQEEWGDKNELLAELHYERAMLVREAWQASHRVGRVHADAFRFAQCPQAAGAGPVASGYGTAGQLVVWNHLCPQEAEQVFRWGFEENGEGDSDLRLTMSSLRSAIRAAPGHVEANVALLVALADGGRWEEVLAGARRFARVSEGHPYALLLAGVALNEFSLPAEALDAFSAALDRLPTMAADEIRDVTFIMDGGRIGEYLRLSGEQRREWERTFWSDKDRTPATAINEREVEHLARSAYALLRFGSVTGDPSEVWVRFGGPRQIHVVDEGSGKLTEFWDYGSGPDMTFVRWVASQAMDLTPESRAYVDDLGKIFPPQ